MHRSRLYVSALLANVGWRAVRLFCGVATLALVLVLTLRVSGQQKPGTLPGPSPQSPMVSAYFPPGGQRGSTIELTLQGRELADAVGVLATFPVQASIVPDAKEPAARCVIKLALAKDAPLGVHALRLVTKRGVSNLLPFCVDDLPELPASGTNRSPSEAQKLPVPCVVSGRVEAEASYYFRLALHAGQRIALEVVGRRMGSPLDSVLILYDPAGRQVAFSDDAPGLQRDARLVYVAKENGEYLVQLRDVRYQGGGNYVYRLRIGDFPCATTAYPLVVKRGSSAKVAFAGPLLDGVSAISVTAPGDPSTLAVLATPHRPGSPPGWPVIVGLSELDETIEQEPNDAPEKAQRITVPGAVHGRFDKPADRDCYRFAVKKGQRLVIEGQSWEYGSPSALYLVLRDTQGKQLANSNPMQDPPRIEYTAPADAELILLVEHLHYVGGPEETYRVVFQFAEPTFRVEALQDRVDVPAGGVGVCFLRLSRLGFNGPVRVQASAPQPIQGETILSGEQNVGLLLLSAPANAPPGAWPIKLLAVGKGEAGEITVPVTITEPLSAAFNNVPFPPRHLLTAHAVSITEPTPFRLEVKYNTEKLPRGQTGLEAIVRVERQAGFEDEVQVFAVAPPPAPNQPVILAAPASGKIARGQQETKLALKLPNNLPAGPLPLAIVGQAKHAARSYQVYARGTPPVVTAGK
ncbi:hypothetical protein HRbin36_00811 [bacterium HR36]|nr:hypothetical protein HRbin36_00811 [bacterium HR36]